MPFTAKNASLKVFQTPGKNMVRRSRKEVHSTKELSKYFGTDGIDLDWEYPVILGFPGHSYKPEDRPNFTAVVKKLHLDKSAKVARTPEVEREMIAAFTPALEVLQLADKLGVLLLQLSPAFSARKHELDELEHVLELTRKFRVAVELRNRNWAEGEQLERSIEFFHEWNAIFVNVDAPRENHFTIMPTDIDAITNSDVAYLRLHGRNAKGYLTGKTVAARFNYNYSDAEIAEVAERTQTLARRAKEVHVVFNNNARDYAPHAALRLRKALGQLVALPPQTGELF